MNTKMSFQIAIPRRSISCHQCNALFISGQEYYSALANDEIEGCYPRFDYCCQCWEKYKCTHNTSARSSWKAKVPLKKEASDLPRQRDMRALYLLKQALNDSENEKNEEAFVLALYLARRRKLYLRQELKLKNGLSSSLYEVAETEETLCVPKLALSELKVEKIQQELARKFKD